ARIRVGTGRGGPGARPCGAGVAGRTEIPVVAAAGDGGEDAPRDWIAAVRGAHVGVVAGRDRSGLAAEHRVAGLDAVAEVVVVAGSRRAGGAVAADARLDAVA